MSIGHFVDVLFIDTGQSTWPGSYLVSCGWCVNWDSWSYQLSHTCDPVISRSRASLTCNQSTSGQVDKIICPSVLVEAYRSIKIILVLNMCLPRQQGMQEQVLAGSRAVICDGVAGQRGRHKNNWCHSCCFYSSSECLRIIAFLDGNILQSLAVWVSWNGLVLINEVALHWDGATAHYVAIQYPR